MFSEDISFKIEWNVCNFTKLIFFFSEFHFVYTHIFILLYWNSEFDPRINISSTDILNQPLKHTVNKTVMFYFSYLFILKISFSGFNQNIEKQLFKRILLVFWRNNQTNRDYFIFILHTATYLNVSQSGFFIFHSYWNEFFGKKIHFFYMSGIKRGNCNKIFLVET